MEKNDVITEVVLGRPGEGKTARIISEVNENDEPSLFVSLECSWEQLRERGLKPSVHILGDDPGVVTLKSIIGKSRKIKARVVAIDYLELLPLSVDVAAIQTKLESGGTQKLIISSQLRRTMESASRERIEKLRQKSVTVLSKGPSSRPNTDSSVHQE